MRFLFEALAWIADPTHWIGPDGIAMRVVEHVVYSALAVVLASLVAIPLGLYIGHTGRFRGTTVALIGGLRALPSLGLLTFLALWSGAGIGQAIVPATIALAVLAIPPVLAASYAGVEAIDAEVIDAARGCGHSELQIVAAVEVPLAKPMILGGIRSACLQVLSTATIAAYLGLGGLGRYILDALPLRDYPKMLAGALLVIALALITDAVLSLIQRISTRQIRRSVQV